MRFVRARPVGRRREGVVPMINVVFLLLIFFLMTATISEPPPFDVILPETHSPEARSGKATLHVASDGRLSYGGRADDAALALLKDDEGPLAMRVDRALPAAELVRIMRLLDERGRGDLRIVVRQTGVEN